IPVLCQQMLHQSSSFLFALFKSHCGSPHVFINEATKGGKTGSAVSLKQARTIVFEPLCCRFVVATYELTTVTSADMSKQKHRQQKC
ncbi:MAG: hypothetical protein KIH44_013270, partial [Octadecabacter sp.]|nr:hypothetical protein [Octadecabacter sp.]